VSLDHVEASVPASWAAYASELVLPVDHYTSGLYDVTGRLFKERQP